MLQNEKRCMLLGVYRKYSHDIDIRSVTQEAARLGLPIPTQIAALCDKQRALEQSVLHMEKRAAQLKPDAWQGSTRRYERQTPISAWSAVNRIKPQPPKHAKARRTVIAEQARYQSALHDKDGKDTVPQPGTISIYA